MKSIVITAITFVLLVPPSVFGQADHWGYDKPEQLIESVPNWIKTNVDWWADEIVSDREFVTALEYLIESEIIISENITVIPEPKIDVDKYGDLKIELHDGTIITQGNDDSIGISKGGIEFPDGSWITDNGDGTITYGDGKEEQYVETQPIEHYDFSELPPIPDEYKFWKYNTSEQFTFSELTIPDWIRNNSKWWADGAISDTDFLSGIEFMIEEKIITSPNITVSDIPKVLEDNPESTNKITNPPTQSVVYVSEKKVRFEGDPCYDITQAGPIPNLYFYWDLRYTSDDSYAGDLQVRAAYENSDLDDIEVIDLYLKSGIFSDYIFNPEIGMYKFWIVDVKQKISDSKVLSLNVKDEKLEVNVPACGDKPAENLYEPISV